MKVSAALMLALALSAIAFSGAGYLALRDLGETREIQVEEIQKLLDQQSNFGTREELNSQARKLYSLVQSIEMLTRQVARLERRLQAFPVETPIIGTQMDSAGNDETVSLAGTSFLRFDELPVEARAKKHPVDLFVPLEDGYGTLSVFDMDFSRVEPNSEQLKTLELVVERYLLVRELRRGGIFAAKRSGLTRQLTEAAFQEFLADNPKLSEYEVEKNEHGYQVTELLENELVDIRDLKKEIRSLLDEAGLATVTWQSPQ